MPEFEIGMGSGEGGLTEVKLGDKIEMLDKLGIVLDAQELEPDVVTQAAGVVWSLRVGVTGVLLIVDVKSEHGDEIFGFRETSSPVGARLDIKHLIKRFIMVELLWPETIDIVDVGVGTGTNIEAGAWGDVGFDVGICSGNSSGAGSGILILVGLVGVNCIPFDEGLEPNDGAQLKVVVAGFEGVTISASLFNAGLKSGHGGDESLSLETDGTLFPETIDNSWRKKCNKSE